MPAYLETVKSFFNADTYAMDTTGITIEDAGDGFAVCSLFPGAKHANADGVVQGGALYTLADYCFAVAANGRALVETGLPDTVTLTANISYLRPAKLGEKLVATAKCVKSGRTACYYEVTVTTELNREKVICAAVINGAVSHPRQGI